MPAYSFDLEIEDKKTNMLEMQAKHIAKYIIQQLSDIKPGEIIGLSASSFQRGFVLTIENMFDIMMGI